MSGASFLSNADLADGGLDISVDLPGPTYGMTIFGNYYSKLNLNNKIFLRYSVLYYTKYSSEV